MATEDKMLKQIGPTFLVEERELESGIMTKYRLSQCPWCGQVYDPKDESRDLKWDLSPDPACGLSLVMAQCRWQLICKNCGYTAVFTELPV